MSKGTIKRCTAALAFTTIISVCAVVPAESAVTANSNELDGTCKVHRASLMDDAASPILSRLDVKASDRPTLRTITFSGTIVEQRVPPSEWKPANATPEELVYYGIPARPKDTEELAAWGSEWVDHYTTTVPIDMCESTGPHHFGAANANWGGLVTYGNTDYTEAYSNVNIPATGNPCGGTAIFDAWAGLGGYTGGNLIQNGYSVGDPDAPASAGANAAWWEALNNTHQNPPDYLVSPNGNFIQQGDSLNIATT